MKWSAVVLVCAVQVERASPLWHREGEEEFEVLRRAPCTGVMEGGEGTAVWMGQ